MEVFGEGFASQTAITLASFTATPVGSSLLLEWETATELHTLGFHLYWAEAPEDDPVRLNEALIPSQDPGAAVGAAYEYLDTFVRLCEDYYYYYYYYYYWLEDVNANGQATRHSPVTAAVVFYRIYLPVCGK